MNDTTLHTLSVVDADVVAGRHVVYCEDVVDPHKMIGRRFRCVTLPLEFTIQGLSSCGTTNLSAFAYTGDSLPSEQPLEFQEIA